MRYQCRIAGKPANYDVRFGQTYVCGQLTTPIRVIELGNDLPHFGGHIPRKERGVVVDGLRERQASE